MKKTLALIGLVSLPLLTGCTTTEQHAGGGALAGAGLGALIGHATGGSAAQGALIGAAAGGIAGTAVGSSKEQAERDSYSPGGSGGQKIQIGPSGNEVDVTGLPPGSMARDPYNGQTFIVQ